jgi:glycosyltransferase involved in cell wall biosynthesis
MQPKTISLVIVSYNRPKEVRGVIRSLLSQTVPPYEIIVVDNNSIPPLDLKVDFPRFTLIRNEREMGSSIGRNIGIKIAKGEYVAFLDDDCVATSNWLEEVQKGLAADAQVLGGTIKPLFRAEVPDWWNEKDFGGCVGVGNIYRKQIWSGNMIVKRSLFNEVGWFNPKLGRHKGKLLSAEELDFLNRAEAQHKALFLPKAEVFHIVPAKRLTLQYALRWYYNAGKSFKIMYGANVPRTGLSIFKLFVSKMLNPMVLRKKSGRVKQMTELALLLGRL